MNFRMWIKALRVIPRITKEEWQQLDVISRWLISTRAAVLIMTFISAAIAGLLAFIGTGQLDVIRWLLLAFGLVLAHATNNLLNDWTDHRRGVDKDNYFRTQYGPQPLESGLMTERELLTYAAVTGALALACGVILFILTGWVTLVLIAVGAFFLLFYTWPLKYIGMGELSVIMVWGPLMIGGGYYTLTGMWDWNVVIASLPYALGVTTVIFGKHIDKLPEDKAKGIHTLPVVIGETVSRYVVFGMVALQYLSVIYLVIIGFFSPVMLVALLGLRSLPYVIKIYRNPKPSEAPEWFSKEAWPLYFVAAAFYQNRTYGLAFLLGLILEAVVRTLGWF